MRSSLRASFRPAVLLFAAAGILVPTALRAEAPKAPSAPAFVSGDWLEKLLPPQVVLIDARPMRDFVAAHIPGAESVSPENLRASAGGVPATLYPPEVLDAVFARVGVESAGHVVVYGNESDIDATFVATAARIAGAACVSVLDGGFSRWKSEGRPVTAERALAQQAKPDFRGNASLLVPVREVLTRVGDGKTVFLDVRTEEQWAAGHIPGAKNRPWKKDVADGSFRPAEAIRAELEAAGISWGKPVVVYCNSGHQASEGFYMLKYKLGHPDVRLYDGSWLEWSMTPGTPRETSAPAETK
mgnify:FL=1